MLKIARLSFITEQKFHKRDAEKLRGYFGNIYKEEDLFHNHLDNNKVIYRMPLIQYKIIDGMLNIFGFNEAVPILVDKFLKVKDTGLYNGPLVQRLRYLVYTEKTEVQLLDGPFK